jgi:hypothetical protein
MTCTWSGSEDSLRSIAHAIERLTGNERVLASTASDPAINVAPLRARGALTQIRARELAFTVEETGELLLREGIELAGESVELLVERTEGGRRGCTWRRCGFVSSMTPVSGYGHSSAPLGTSRTTSPMKS